MRGRHTGVRLFNMVSVEDVRKVHVLIRSLVVEKLENFREMWRSAGEERLFAELVFCLLTPQSKARLCWEAVERLLLEGLLLHGSEKDVEGLLHGVRFRKVKARYVVYARQVFWDGSGLNVRAKISHFSRPSEARRWLVDHVKGMGYKEASHFLRNIGLGEDLAILDRHVLRVLFSLGVIDSIPKSISPRTYMSLEERFREFSEKVSIPLSHLDFVFWYISKGEIFK